MSVTEENVCQLIQGDHRLTVYEIVAGFGISYSKIHAVVTDDLGYQKIPTKWYHRLLTDEQRRWCFQVCQRQLIGMLSYNGSFQSTMEHRKKVRGYICQHQNSALSWEGTHDVFWDILHINFLQIRVIVSF